jgi:rhodanese-related sulfurtransferase
MMIEQLTAEQALALLSQTTNAVLLDVREPWEVQLAAVKQPFIPMPMQSIPARLSELPTNGPIVCLCHHGARSQQVAHFLAQQGFEQVFNLQGGIDAWSQTVDTSVARY